MNKFSILFITLFNIGKINKMPGTFGSFFSYALLLIIYNLFSYLILIIIFILIFIISNYLINIYISKKDDNDPKEIVIDEFLGCFVIFLFFPIFNEMNLFLLLIISFILFRFFDITKFFPINFIDKKINNAFGIIFDDLIAGIYSLVILYILNEFI